MLLTLEDLFMDLAYMISRLLPFECMDAAFMQRALLALLLLAPLAAVSGIQVVNARMAFFSDAISHSAFAGVAIGVLAGIGVGISMPLTAVLVGLSVMFLKRISRLSSDTVIGVIFSAVAAFGLAVVARDRAAADNMRMFLFGDILTIDPGQLLMLAGLLIAFFVYQLFAFNRLLLVSINPMLAAVHKVRVELYQYIFAALLSLVVICAVRTAGVILVTALLVVPAAAARNFAKNTAGMFRITMLISYVCSVAGLILSAQPEIDVPAGTAVVLCTVVCFAVSLIVAGLRAKRAGDSSL